MLNGSPESRRNIEAATEPLFGNAGTLRVERAVAELRAGRPVRIEAAGRTIAALALDAATPAVFAAFNAAAGGTHSLYLTGPRASVLGLSAPQGALVPADGLSFEEACRLGYLRDPNPPAEFEPAEEVHREAAGLARLALLLPALLVAEIGEDDPTFADCAGIALGDVDRERAIAGRSFEIVSRAPVPLKGIASAEFVVFRGGIAQRDQLAIVVGGLDVSGPVPVRVHSSCLTGDLFGSLKCDCGDQLRTALQTLQERGGGVLVYLDQEGRGTGIASKMRAYSLQCEGLDTVDADAELGFGADERRYEAAAAILDALGIEKVDLLTNNPRKIALLRAEGIDVVSRSAVFGEVTIENRNYLKVKAERSGHLIDVDKLAGRR